MPRLKSVTLQSCKHQLRSMNTKKNSRNLRNRIGSGPSRELRRILKEARKLPSTSSNRVSSSGSSIGGERLLFMLIGKNLLMKSLGMRRMMTATGREIAPRPSDMAHWTPLRRVADKALPPNKIISTCPVMVIRLIPIKYQFRCRPSKTLSLLSRRRLLCRV